MKFVNLYQYAPQWWIDNSPVYIIEMSDGNHYLSSLGIFKKLDWPVDSQLEDAIKKAVVEISKKYGESDELDKRILQFTHRIMSSDSNPDISKLKNLSYMFASSPITEFSEDITQATRTVGMFMESSLETFNSHISKDVVKDCMFSGTPYTS